MMADSPRPCFHCGLPCPEGESFSVKIDGRARPMCCPGCQAVANAIVENNLTDYYRLRSEAPRNPADLIPAALKEAAVFDQDRVQESFVKTREGDRREAALILEGIVCAACVWLSERHVSSLPGVESFRVNYSTHRAQVSWDSSQIQLSDILRAIAAIGYVAHPFDAGRQEAIFRRERRQSLWRIAVAGFGAMQVMMLAVAMYSGDFHGMDDDLRRFMRWVSMLIAVPVVLYSAQPFFKAAWRDLRSRHAGMDVPVALAIGAATIASIRATLADTGEVYFDSATMFTFFLLTGRYLEMSARHRAGQAAEELVRLLPAVATRLVAGNQETVPVADLRVGDTVLVRPGETVPADGHIIEGVSSVNESLITGESLPLAKLQGECVTGGTVNVESPLTIVIDKVGEQTVLAAIVRLLDRAQTEKPRVARTADRVAGWFVSIILLLAAVVAWWWWQHDPEQAFAITLSVLVVTCPCALSLATPAAVTAATGALTRSGLLVTRGHALETLARASHILFDKTGTLTYGRLHLSRVKLFRAEVARDTVLRLAAALEQGSEHPVGSLLASQIEAPPADAPRATPGEGMQGVIDGDIYRIGTREFVAELFDSSTSDVHTEHTEATQVWLADAQGLIAQFEITDTLRPQAQDAIGQLKELGLHSAILSGDARGAVQDVATALGIDEARAQFKPEDKLSYVRSLQERGATVAMVGDGVNDAPVLAQAQVSIAMGAGTQLAQASADMVLLSDDLGKLAFGVRKARQTLTVIRQNLSWALFYNLSAVPLAAAGFVAPWMAALGMSASSLVVVLNALRLTERQDRKILKAATPGKQQHQ